MSKTTTVKRTTTSTTPVTDGTVWFTIKSPKGKLLRKYVRTNRISAIRAVELDIGREWKGSDGLRKAGYRVAKVVVTED